MAKLKVWISAARLRTLPLSVSGILVGSAMAMTNGFFDGSIFFLAILATLGFQILSNFANDYGDGVKGTDNEERIGPARAMQSGLLTAKALRKGIIFTAGLTLLISFALIYNAFDAQDVVYAMVFFLLGLLAIAAAITYTVGNKAYGYRGLGDVFVFIFFGIVAVCGSYFLYTKSFSIPVVLPAITVGFLSMAVLNLNNMRDRISDERAGKRTLAVILGPEKSKIYHAFLLVGALVASVAYFSATENYRWAGASLVVFLPLMVHLKKVVSNQAPALLDPELKKVALSTFGYALLFLVGIWVRNYF